MQKVTTWTNLHRHGEFSFFDGFGKYTHAAAHAKKMGQQALGIAEHGTVSGLVKHYQACKENGIKPILGCEIYFQPKFDKEKPSYHMCLFCKDLKGYQNLMAIITEANSQCFYRHANVTLANLRKHREGLICSTACIGGWASQAILKGNPELAEKRIAKLHSIFGDDLYVEIMPYTVIDNGRDLQKAVDTELIDIIERNGYKGIITTDSHYIRAEDYSTFQLLFKIKGKNFDNDYSQRYMPDEKEVRKRFQAIYHKKADAYLQNTMEIANKCNVDLDSFEEKIPQVNDTGIESKKLLRQLVVKGLKKEGKYLSKYIARAKRELEVIEYLGFEEYFLICWDLVKYALDNGIGYGPGRGSVCGSLVAYALNITRVDPLELGTLFERFLRKDKKALPDIDMDFEKSRRDEIVQYIYSKYAGRATQIAAYGYYRVANLCNDLAKVLEIPDDEIKQAKDILNKMFPEISHGAIAEYDEIMENQAMQEMEEKYLFVTHFAKMCGLIRYMGKHAAGVAITSGEITDQIALIKSAGKESGLQSCYDLNDLEYLKVLKIDVLGLATIDVNKFVENETGEIFSDKMYKDQIVLDQFSQGNTTAIFQFDKRGAKALLCQIEADNIQDVIAANAINRPAPLQMGIPDQFAHAKNGATEKTLASKYLPDTYGCFVYQEDIITIGRKLSKMPWQDIDAVMKGLKRVTGGKEGLKKKLAEIKRRFVIEAKAKNPNITRAELNDLFDAMTGGYLFNKGHAAGYAILAVQQMYYKYYYPLEFWCGTLRVEEDEHKLKAYEAEAVRNGVVIVPAHVNGTANYEIVDFAGGQAISRGLQHIKGIGPKAAKDIEEHGPYYDKEMFLDEVTRRIVNKRVIEVLDSVGAFVFDEKKLLKMLLSENKRLYNSTLKAG